MEHDEELLEELRKLDAVWQQTRLRTPLKTMLLRQKAKVLAEVERRNARLNELVQAFYQRVHWDCPAFYQALAAAAKRTVVRLRVPETLLRQDGVTSLITTDDYGVVKLETGPDTENHFYFLVQRRQKEFKELRCRKLPYYVHIQGNKVRLTQSSTTAADMSRNSGATLHLLQRFVPPLSSKVSKMRVHWDKRRNPASYTVISKTDLYQSGDIDPEVRNEPYSVFARTRTLVSNARPQSVHLKPPFSNQPITISVSESFQGLNSSLDRLTPVSNHTRSFSLPKRTSTSESKHSRISHGASDAFLASAWLVFSSNLKQSSILENKSLSSIILGTLANVRKVAEVYLLNSEFTELIVDFMKDTNGQWIFLACKGLIPLQPVNLSLEGSVRIEEQAVELNESVYQEEIEQEADVKPATFRSFYNLTEEEVKNFDKMKKILEAQVPVPKKSATYINLKDVKQDCIKQYGQLMGRTKSGRIPKKIVKLQPPMGPTESTTVIYDLKPHAETATPVTTQAQIRDVTVRSIMGKLSRKMDSSLENARHGANCLKIANALNLMKSNKKLSLMRAFETSMLNMKEHKTLKRIFDVCPDADFHIKAINAFPCFVYGSKGMSGKELKALHRRFSIPHEAYDYFLASFLTCMRLEGMEPDMVSVMKYRLEYFRSMIVSAKPSKFPSFIINETTLF